MDFTADYVPTSMRLPPDGHEVTLDYFDLQPGGGGHCMSDTSLPSKTSSCEDSGVFLDDSEAKVIGEKYKSNNPPPIPPKPGYVDERILKEQYSSRGEREEDTDGERINGASEKSGQDFETSFSNSYNITKNSVPPSHRVHAADNIVFPSTNDFYGDSSPPPSDIPPFKKSSYKFENERSPIQLKEKTRCQNVSPKNVNNLSFKEKLALFAKAEQVSKVSETSNPIKHSFSSDNLSNPKIIQNRNPIYIEQQMLTGRLDNNWESSDNVYKSSADIYGKVPTKSSIENNFYSQIKEPNSHTEMSNTMDNAPVITRKHSVESLYPQSQLLGFKRYSLCNLGSSKNNEDSIKSYYSLNESKSSAFSKLKGLIIPNKTSSSATLGKSLPTLYNPENSMNIVTSQPIKMPPRCQSQLLTFQNSNETITKGTQLSNGKTTDATGFKMQSLLKEPPWKSGTNSLPKYSPAFKRRTLELPKPSSSTHSSGSSSVSSPISPHPPSSPTSVSSSSTCSSTKPSSCLFSLTHSKPVIPLTPEKPNMSPPSISSETEQTSSSGFRTNSPPAFIAKKREVPPPPPIPSKKPPLMQSNSLVENSRTDEDHHTYILSSTEMDSQDLNPSVSAQENASPALNEKISKMSMIERVAEIIEMSVDNLSKKSASYSQPVDHNSNALDRLDNLLGTKEENESIDGKINSNSNGNNRNNLFPSCYLSQDSNLGNNKGEDKTLSDQREIEKSHLIENAEVVNNRHNSLTKGDSHQKENTEPETNNMPNKLLEELSLGKRDYWSDVSKQAPCSKQDSDDDAYSSVSQKTDDSRNTLDDSCSDLTCDSYDPDLKPRRLSQQKTVLKTYVETTDSAKNFKALAEKWEQRSGDSGNETPTLPSTLPPSPSILLPIKKETKKQPQKEIIFKPPSSLMPRVIEEHSLDPPRFSSNLRDSIKSSSSIHNLNALEKDIRYLDASKKRSEPQSRRKSDFYLETRSFRQSLEYLGPPRAKVISTSRSVSDICKAFETQAQLQKMDSPSLSNNSYNASKNAGDDRLAVKDNRHHRMSSIDSTASESSSTPAHYGSMGSLTSSSSVLSAAELQQLIDDANQSLEESGDGPNHEIIVVVLHRDYLSGSVGITLAGGADYEVKEITIHRVIVGSPADRDGRIRKGDRVISINGRNLRGVTHRQALEILKAPRSELVLVLSREKVRPQPAEKTSRKENELSCQETSIPECQKGGGTLATINLIKDGAGLGFIIEGGKDSPLGDRPITIKRIFKCGAAEKSGLLDVGDEIVSVNSCPITSTMTRTEVWNLMKKLPDGIVALTVRKLTLVGS